MSKSTIDLDHLSALEEAAKQMGTWAPHGVRVALLRDDWSAEDAAFIDALVTAAPALIAELRALREVEAAARAVVRIAVVPYSDKGNAAQAAFDAALSRVPR